MGIVFVVVVGLCCSLSADSCSSMCREPKTVQLSTSMPINNPRTHTTPRMIIFVDKFRRKPENRTTIRTPGIDRICVCVHIILYVSMMHSRQFAEWERRRSLAWRCRDYSDNSACDSSYAITLHEWIWLEAAQHSSLAARMAKPEDTMRLGS